MYSERIDSVRTVSMETVTGFVLAGYLVCSLLLSGHETYWPLWVMLLPLSLAAFKVELLGLIWSGGSYISPEAPRSVLIVSSWLYSLLVVFTILMMARDAAGLLLSCWGISLPMDALCLVAMLGALALATWGTWIGLQPPRVREQLVRLENLPEHCDGLRVAVLADIHATSVNHADFVAEIVRRTNALKPDLIVLPGDMVDGAVSLRAKDVAPLASLHAPLGVYAVAGNHEYYSGYNSWMAKFRALGIQVLENSNAEILPGLTLAGVGDPVGDEGFPGQSYAVPGVDLASAVAGAKGSLILLSHQPCVAREAESYGVDLQISGHTHGGMMLGLDRWIVAPHNKGFVAGLYQYNQTQVYVSRGAGIWPGFTLRLGVPGEISLLTLSSR
ncbi:MAG: metallophosphoesterase [Akkermansia sp.]